MCSTYFVLILFTVCWYTPYWADTKLCWLCANATVFIVYCFVLLCYHPLLCADALYCVLTHQGVLKQHCLLCADTLQSVLTLTLFTVWWHSPWCACYLAECWHWYTSLCPDTSLLADSDTLHCVLTLHWVLTPTLFTAWWHGHSSLCADTSPSTDIDTPHCVLALHWVLPPTLHCVLTLALHCALTLTHFTVCCYVTECWHWYSSLCADTSSFNDVFLCILIWVKLLKINVSE